MSLINRMLQDLDKRSSEGTATHAMHGQIRAVPPRRRAPLVWFLLGPVVVLVIGIFTWYWQHKDTPVTQNAMPAVDMFLPSLKLSSVLHIEHAPSGDDHAPDQKDISAAARPITAPMPAETPQLKFSVDPKWTAVPGPVGEWMGAAAPDREMPANMTQQVKEISVHQRAENAYRRAILAQQQDKLAETIGELEQALQLDPRHGAARQALVGILLENKRQDEAMRKLQDGLSLDASQSGMAMILARLQVERGDVPSAIETLQRSLSYALDRADYQAFLAALYQRQGRHKEAAEYYSIALRQAPQNGVWWMGLGISLQAENRLPQAQDAFGRAKASNTLSAELLAFVEQRLNQLQH